jgi:hypothetical protein
MYWALLLFPASQRKTVMWLTTTGFPVSARYTLLLDFSTGGAQASFFIFSLLGAILVDGSGNSNFSLCLGKLLFPCD